MHIMQTIETGLEGWTVECPECGKVRVIYRQPGRPPATINDGDADALHTWASGGGFALDAAASQPSMDDLFNEIIQGFDDV
jgi:hypothetical protein